MIPLVSTQWKYVFVFPLIIMFTMVLSSLAFSQSGLPYNQFESYEQKLSKPFTTPITMTIVFGILSAGSLGVGAWQTWDMNNQIRDYKDSYNEYQNLPKGLAQSSYDNKFQEYEDSWNKAKQGRILSIVGWSVGGFFGTLTMLSLFTMEKMHVKIVPDINHSRVELSIRF